MRSSSGDELSSVSGAVTQTQSALHTARPSKHPRSAELVDPSADWVVNSTVSRCSYRHCNREFTMLCTKHHCRWCGGIYCDACAPRTALRNGALHRRCARCRIPVIFRSFVNPITGKREATPLQVIISFLPNRAVSRLMQTCRTMVEEFPVSTFPFRASIRERFPSFHEGAKIGEGSFGVVYKCEDRDCPTNRYVVLKKVVKGRWMTYSMWCKFLTEVNVLMQVKHPNVAGVHEVFQTLEELVMVMEAGHGGSARQACSYLHEHGLPLEPFAALVIRDVARALDYLYRELQLVHRDVKLDNIVLSAEYDRAVIIDFGLAEHIKDSSGQGYTPSGTPGYASPENVHAAGVACQPVFRASGLTMHKADLFSLGVTAYQILCRQLPIRSRHFDRQYEEIMRGLPSGGGCPQWRSCSPEARDLIQRLLSLKAEDRPDGAAIAAHPFIVRATKDAQVIFEHRQHTRAQLDAEERDEWIVLDAGTCHQDMGDAVDLQQFPRGPIGRAGNLYDSLVARLRWSVGV